MRATLPLVSWLYSKWVATAVLAAGVFGLYLVSRQWDTFHATFLHFFSPDGAVLYALALIGAMVLHELGHAYTAVRYGCRVPSMGVALLVLFPVLYTDVTDAWRLASRRQRLAIGAAGMLTELGIAALSTLAWSFMPEGPWRSAAFILATVTWVMTLAINLSPFMRFDGYYLLADWWGVDNLQSRAFSLARWKLRQLLFSVPEQKPETVPPPVERRLILYAWATWVYRLIVFTGIALLVYHLFFKLLGVVLFAVEIVWFIALSVARELKVWWGLRRAAIRTHRTLVLGTVVAALLTLLCVPWSGHVRFPAVLGPTQHSTLYAPSAARIARSSLLPGKVVRAGEVLVQLESPALIEEIELSAKRVEFYRLQSLRAATTEEKLSDLRVVMPQLAAERSRLDGLRRQ